MTKKRPKILPGQIISTQCITPSRKIIVKASIRNQLGAECEDWMVMYALGNGRVAVKKISSFDASLENEMLKDL